MLTLLVLALTLVATVAAYAVSRRFVRERLRFVTAVQRRSAPVIAGGGALALAALLAALLPVVGLGTAISLGAAVGMGVAAGARDIRRGAYWVTDG
jgi:hypothetical protein